MGQFTESKVKLITTPWERIEEVMVEADEGADLTSIKRIPLRRSSSMYLPCLEGSWNRGRKFGWPLLVHLTTSRH